LRFLEADPASNTPALWPLLARHAEGAGDEARAKQYHRLAGRDAAKRFDNVNALMHLEYVCKDFTDDREDALDAFELEESYQFLGRQDDAIAVLRRLEGVKGAWSTFPQVLYLRKARQAWQRQAWDEAEGLLKKSIEQARLKADTIGQGKALLNLAGGVYGPSGRLEEAKACLEKALALPKGKGQAIFRIMALVNLGSIAWHEGEITLATSRYADALSRARRANLPRHEAFAAYNLLAIHYEEGQYISAARVGKRALILAQALSLREVERTVLSSLALTWTALGQLDFAEEAAERVRAESAHEGNAYWQGVATETMAHVTFLKTEYAEALRFSEEAQALFKGVDERRHQVFVVFERLRQFYYLGLLDCFVKEIKAAGGREALLEAAANERPLQGLVVLLENLPHRRRGMGECQRAGVRGQGAGEKRREETLTPDARLLEWSLCGGPPPDIKGASLSHEEKVRLAYARIASYHGPFSPQRAQRKRRQEGDGLVRGALSLHASPLTLHSSAWRLLRKAPAGVWGLRLWGLLYVMSQGGGEEREIGKSAQKKWNRKKIERLRQEGLRALYQCRAQSPKWVWEKIVAFPEIKALIKGEPSRGKDISPPRHQDTKGKEGLRVKGKG
jgi:tetratricopeptide (TPR) repeat protein